MTWIPDRALDRLRGTAEPWEPAGSRYELIEVIGRGGMSTVHRARDRVLDRDVAVKVLDEPHADQVLAGRLESEARVLARLEHPAIVPVHDLGVLPDGRPYYVMKLVRGRDLAAAVAAEPSLHGRLRLFERICEAVAFAHARDVIHRDLKPSNVMVGAFGEVLVLDWGLAKLRATRDAPVAPPSAPSASGSARIGESKGREPRTAAGTVLGTPGYMAPEQLAGEPVDERTDVYALGVLLDWLLAVPLGAGAAAGGTPATRTVRESAVPRPLAAIADRARAVSPGDRYPGVTELVADIRRYLDGLAVTAHEESALDRMARFARRHRVAIALVAAYLLMRVALLLWARV